MNYENRQTDSLYLMACGIEQCLSGELYATGRRDGCHFHVILSGKGTLTVRGRTQGLHAGQMFVTKEGEETIYQADKTDPWSYCWVVFGGEKAEYYLDQAGLSEGVNVRDCNVNPSGFLEIVNSMLDRPELHLAQDLWRLGALYRFLSLAIETGSGPGGSTHNPEYSPEAYVRHGLAYIQTNFTSMKIGDVSRAIGIDRSYFTKLFTRAMGFSPMEYMILLRMRESARLLTTTDFSVQEIAGLVGYTSLQSFIRIFKSYYHCSPGEYRKLPEEKRVHLKYPNGELFHAQEKGRKA